MVKSDFTGTYYGEFAGYYSIQYYTTNFSPPSLEGRRGKFVAEKKKSHLLFGYSFLEPCKRCGIVKYYSNIAIWYCSTDEPAAPERHSKTDR
jgi:hypothetical protein